MDTSILRKAGLTESQAKGYLALIEHGALSPADLADKIGESRTNGYAIADKLVALGLATKKDGSKATYEANHPSALETLAEKRRKVVARDEQIVKQGLSPLIDYFYTKRDTPGVTTYIGKVGIETVYDAIINEAKDLEYLRSAHDSGYMSHEFYQDYMLKRAKADIITRPISLDIPRSRARQNDEYDNERLIIDRTWLPVEDYTANVEWSVYGDKVSTITFGEEPIALTIHSKEIADSMRQIFKLIRKTIPTE